MIVRPSSPGDAPGIEALLFYGDMVFRHLDWLDPGIWLEDSSTLILEDSGKIEAILVIPEEPAGIHWIRMLVKHSRVDLDSALQSFWNYILQNYHSEFHAALILHSFDHAQILKKVGFGHFQSIVFLSREQHSTFTVPPLSLEVHIRTYEPSDLDKVVKVDQESFIPLWRNSKRALEAGTRAKGYSTVAVLGEEVIGYQLSNINFGSMHLARLAVLPTHQGKGIAAALLNDLFHYGDSIGCGNITVNTQSNNQGSLRLYQKAGFKLQDQTFPVFEFGNKGE